MRKITTEAVNAFMNYKDYKNDNTEVIVNHYGSYLRLHGNLIAVFNNNTCPDNPNKISVSLAGWNTMTTRERLNGIPGVSVGTRKGIAYLNGQQIEDNKFYTI